MRVPEGACSIRQVAEAQGKLLRSRLQVCVSGGLVTLYTSEKTRVTLETPQFLYWTGLILCVNLGPRGPLGPEVCRTDLCW